MAIADFGMFSLILSLAAACWGAWWIWEQFQIARQKRLIGVELKSPFLAEVLLDGVPVATLTDRVVTEMFWRSYRFNPLPGVDQEKILDEKLWTIPCGCTFRDPATGHLCKTAWTSRAPQMVDGVMIVYLRQLYFKPEQD